jgi:hypothetical protein
MQDLYEAILENERILEDAFTYEVLARQAEASDNQARIDFSRKMRNEYRRCAERAELDLAQQLPERKVLHK